MNETIRMIESLKTVRKFTDQPITKEHMSLILNSCVNAASASARQAYSIIVIDDKAVMKEIGYVGDKMLVFCVDLNRMMDTARYLGYEYKKEISVVDFMTGSTDTILAAQTAVIAAKSLGIDSFFSNCIHRGNIDRIYKLLNLPEEYCFPLIALLLGYEDKSYKKTSNKGRLNGPGIIHTSKYQKLSEEDLQNIVAEYDNPEKHFLSLIDGWREKGYNHYLVYFFEVWCSYSKIGEDNGQKNKAVNSYDEVERTLVKSGFLSENNRGICVKRCLPEN